MPNGAKKNSTKWISNQFHPNLLKSPFPSFIMKKTLLLLTITFIFLITLVQAQTNVYEFYQIGCSHCIKVDQSGVLERVAELPNVTLQKVNIHTPEGKELYDDFHKKIKDMPAGTPIAIIECNNQLEYLIGDTPIIDNLESLAQNCKTIDHKLSLTDKLKSFLETCFNSDLQEKGRLSTLGLLALIAAAFIDSINPCAFGVLLFLMLSLLNLGSNKRALKAGLFYSFVVFVVYFLAGLGLFQIIQSVTQIKDWIYLAVGSLVLILALVEFRDYYQATKGKESILRITPKLKPFIEKYSKKGTLMAILILGVVVAIFELPCTGGIYLGIISLVAQAPELATFYLLIYNIIFVLPLIIMTLLIYKGMSPERLQKWSNTERTWMKLGAAIVMLLIATYLLWNPIKILIGMC
jgi:cytochrome c biogenesis protein CcdA